MVVFSLSYFVKKQYYNEIKGQVLLPAKNFDVLGTAIFVTVNDDQLCIQLKNTRHGTCDYSFVLACPLRNDVQVAPKT